MATIGGFAWSVKFAMQNQWVLCTINHGPQAAESVKGADVLYFTLVAASRLGDMRLRYHSGSRTKGGGKPFLI
jgi:hypothetical protein